MGDWRSSSAGGCGPVVPAKARVGVGDADKVRPLLQRVLGTISRQFNVAAEYIPLEVEEVVRRALFEALRLGKKEKRPKSSLMDIYKNSEEDE